jgi:hypothetical protein
MPEKPLFETQSHREHRAFKSKQCPIILPGKPKALKTVQRRYDCCDRSACRIDKINKRLNESNRYRVVLSAIFMRSTISSICAYVMQMTEIASITRNLVGSFKQMFSRMKS